MCEPGSSRPPFSSRRWRRRSRSSATSRPCWGCAFASGRAVRRRRGRASCWCRRGRKATRSCWRRLPAVCSTTRPAPSTTSRATTRQAARSAFAAGGTLGRATQCCCSVPARPAARRCWRSSMPMTRCWSPQTICAASRTRTPPPSSGARVRSPGRRHCSAGATRCRATRSTLRHRAATGRGRASRRSITSCGGFAAARWAWP